MKLIILLITLQFLYCNKSVVAQTTNIIKIENINIDTNITYETFRVDNLPCFSSGKDSLENYLNYQLSKILRQIDFDGIFFISFVIDRNGKLNNIEIQNKSGTKVLNELIVNIFKNMPKWESGKIKGVRVKTLMCLPLILKIR